MKIKLLDRNWDFLAPSLLVLFMFFIPISPSIKSIFFGCAMASILLTPYYSKHILEAFNSLWGRTALILFLFVVLACSWSIAPYGMQLGMVGKYFKLIYLPVLAVGFTNPKTRKWCLNGYLFAIFITCVVSILKSIQIIQSFDPGEVFYNHIITGFMTGLGAYLAGLFAFQSKGWLRVLYSLLVLLTSYQVLFINSGRTGYVLYFILMGLLLFQQISFKRAVVGVLLLCGMFTAVYEVSPILQERTSDLIKDIKQLQAHNPNTSIGYRIQFHNYAKSLWLAHPFTGIGTGGFKYSFSLDKPVPAWGDTLNDPHSQYWMTLSEHGLIGMILLILFLGSLFITSMELTETRPVLLGILVAFCIGSVSDTILCYSTAGYLLVVMSALCFGELIEKRTSDTIAESNFDILPDNNSGNPIHA